MKFLITGILLFTSLVFAQQYVQKQESQIVNVLTNPGFESGKTSWTISASSTVTVVSGTQALFGAASIKFQPTASVSTTVSSGLYTVPEGLEGEECNAVVHYRTNEFTNYFVANVRDASGTLLASEDLTPKIVLGVPTEETTFQTLEFTCPFNKKMELEIFQDTVGGYLIPDGMHLGSKIGSLANATDIITALGYVPADQAELDTVSATVITNTANIASVSSTVAGLEVDLNDLAALEDTHNNENLKKTFNLADVTSATAARNNLGLGSVATENVVPVTKGGTGVSSVTTGDLLVGSGTSLVKLPIGTAGQVLTAVSGTAVWSTGSSSVVSSPTVQRFTTASGTYTTPVGVKYIRVSIVGGGGSGGTDNNTDGNGGISSTFGTSLITAGGGSGGIDGGTGTGAGGGGGTFVVNSPAVSIISVGGGTGSGGMKTGGIVIGGAGGNSFFGGAGGTGPGNTAGSNGYNASTNSGSGGGGCSHTGGGAGGGGGGGSGGYVSSQIDTPAASYTYTVGAGGAAVSNNCVSGSGASGVVIVEEFY